MLHHRYLRIDNTHNVITLFISHLVYRWLAQDKAEKCCVKVYRTELSSHGFK